MTVVPIDQGNAAPRALPHNAEIEAALLGILLIRNRVYDEICEVVEAHHFYDEAHQRIYATIARMIDRQKDASPATIQRAFENDDALKDVGGTKYIWDLSTCIVNPLGAKDYAETIRDLFLRRELICACEAAVEDAFDGTVESTAAEQIENHEARLAIAVQAPSEHEPMLLHEAGRLALDAAEAAFQNRGRMVGVPTGLVDIDEATGGLTPGNLIIIAARPSMGKSALAQCITSNAARRGYKGILFSLEMSMEEIALREQAQITGIPSERIRRGQIDMDEWNDIVQAQDSLADLPFVVDDKPALTLAAVRSRARRLKRRSGLHLIVIDYLQLLQATRDAMRKNSRVAEVSEITAGLKALAKELDVPVLALSQLSRNVEMRDDKRPRLADLRESGSIEQDADAVWFIFRDEYYVHKDEPRKRADEDTTKFDQRWNRWADTLKDVKNACEILIAKQRQGPVCTKKLHFNGPLMKFTNWGGEDSQDYLL